MSGNEPRRRVAIVVPTNRAWVWHEQIVSLLRNSFEIDVYSNGNAPPYPRPISIWLRLEKSLLGEFHLVNFARAPAIPWRQPVDVKYTCILNFSEEPIFCDVPVIEPRYQRSLDSLNLLAVLFAHKNPYLSFHLQGKDEPIVASYLAIPDKMVLSRGLQTSFARLSIMAERATKHLSQATRAAILPQSPNSSPAFSFATMARFGLCFGWDKIFGRLVRRLKVSEHWSVVLLRLDNWDVTRKLSVQNFAILPDDDRRFFADPFLFADAGRDWLFFEELEYRTGRGIISCAQVKDENHITAPHPVLQRPYHLSYPFVFRQGNEIYMIPETGSNNTVELYRAQSFPFSWVLHRILLENVTLYDATLLQHQNRFWLFAATAHEGSAPQDELALFYSENLEGPWRPHRLNPVKSDCRSARPAGRVVVRDNRLFRPAQDCEPGYGSALIWCEITELTPDRFDEHEVGRWHPNEFLPANGFHTFDSHGTLSAIDVKRQIWKYPFHAEKHASGSQLSQKNVKVFSDFHSIRVVPLHKETARSPIGSDDIGVVAIGRNEGARLIACLTALKSQTNKIVYVDFGSTDGSSAAAKGFGAHVVNLDLSRPFTAARARNEGFEALKALHPNIRFIQFVDGDCILSEGWLETATAFISKHEDVAIVTGRLWERFPTASIYNKLCDLEWDTPIGEIYACGGNSFVRVEAFEAVGGFQSELIAGEEPELCLRLREKGWIIWRVDADMAEHDAAMTRFTQWWRRSVRSGFGLASVWMLHRRSLLNFRDRLMVSTLFWGGILPITICLGALLYPAVLLAFLVYFVQICRIALAEGPNSSLSWIFAAITMVSKFAYCQGVLKYFWYRLRHWPAPQFEYK